MNYRFYPRVKVLHTFLISLALLLVSCGGGGGDSSSGGGSTSVYTGTYGGTMTATLSSPGAPTQDVSGIIQIKIDDAGNVSVLLDPPSTVWATGTLSGDNFTITSTFGFNEDGVVCNGPATMTGNIQNDQITGTFTGNINCTTQGVTIPFTINGTYTVVKTSISAAVQSDGFSQSLLSAIQNALRSAR